MDSIKNHNKTFTGTIKGDVITLKRFAFEASLWVDKYLEMLFYILHLDK